MPGKSGESYTVIPIPWSWHASFLIWGFILELAELLLLAMEESLQKW